MTDPNCFHISAWVCDKCDNIHIASFSSDHKIIGQVNVDPNNLNALIIELMELRANGHQR